VDEFGLADKRSDKRSIDTYFIMIFFSFLRSLIALISIHCLVILTSGSDGSEWYYENWCGGPLQYLDDSYCAKIFPSSDSGATIDYRDWSCQIPPSSTVPEGFQAEIPFLDISVDNTTLASIVSDEDVNLCVILTQRVVNASSATGVSLYNKYMCAGSRSRDVAYETWSSSKVFAMVNAAGRLRSNESQCGAGNAYNRQFGLDGDVTGNEGPTALGDLATIVCSYDHTQGYSSNALSSYFHDIGWRQRLYDLVQDWLLVGNDNDTLDSDVGRTRSHSDDSNKKQQQQRQQTGGNEEEGRGQGQDPLSLGGNYGEPTPTDLSFDVESGRPADRPDGNQDPSTCSVDQDPQPVTFSNSLSALAAAELLRRIALHRELDQSLQFPGATWRDIQTVLYGAETSLFFSGLQWGGMTADTAIFLQAALDLPSLLQEWGASDQQSQQWRIFSKLGAGYSTTRDKGEIVSNAYACIPKYDTAGITRKSDNHVDGPTGTRSTLSIGKNTWDTQTNHHDGDGTGNPNPNPVPIGGVEVTIAARGSVSYDYSLAKAQHKVHESMDKVMDYLLLNL